MPAAEMDAVSVAVSAVVSSGTYVGGDVVSRFEVEFARAVGPARYCVSVASGLDALILALSGLGLPHQSSVLVPPNDAGFAALAVQSVGLVPVLMDVSEEGLATAELITASATPDVSALIVTHLHGLAADLSGVGEWCRERGVRLVEDCAQAHGAQGVGLLGDVATFSFYPTKNLGALGDGGAVVTADPNLAKRLRSLREYGWGDRFSVQIRDGRNSRLDAVQAAVLLARLPYLEGNNSTRRDVVARYQEAAPNVRFLARDDSSFVAHHAVVVDPTRDGLMARLQRAGIGHAVHYPALVSEMPGISLGGTADTPTARRLRDQLISLPCFPGITDHEVDAVSAVLATWLRFRHG
jgi:dTDP-4-amino-4,6-dideoxygalactose transaminase